MRKAERGLLELYKHGKNGDKPRFSLQRKRGLFPVSTLRWPKFQHSGKE